MTTATPPTRPVIAMLVADGITLLDLVGPHTALAHAADVHLVAPSLDPVVSDTGVRVLPTTTPDALPTDVDVLFVPGGPATAAMMTDERVLDFLRTRAPRARYVTAVCTGTLVLGAAGLLRGRRAATHWTVQHLLPLFGAEAVPERVVVDGELITGGGVTAGIDFGLTLLAEFAGRDTAELAQLAMEYDPKPPFDSGSPATASPAHVALARQLTAPLEEAVRTMAAGHPGN